MGLWGWLTGAPEVASKTIDAAIRTGDALVYTDEEKAENAKKIMDWSLKYLEATNPQNVTRRVIAVQIVAVYLLILIAACIAGYFNRGHESYAAFLFDVLKEILTNPFNIILGFYFFTQTVRALMTGKDR